ncbi:MAG: TonB-dependent receptor, partial [Ignavibacterium sp.]|nr:TonB-dependent receptor [Ignavibacterium sp.]
DADYPATLDWFADPDIGVHPTMAEFLRPRRPIIGYLYLQDKLELQDFVLNVGVRMDYFDIKSHEFVNPALPFGDPNNPNNLDLNKYDIGDFKIKDVEIEYSPRIGIGFPVTESTVFHAQYGRFIQLPELNLMYSGPFDPLGFNGALLSEETTQYEVGFRQLFGTNSALSITAFYKNTKSLVDYKMEQYQEVEGGEIYNLFLQGNVDFGTIKGFAFSFDVIKLSYLSASIQYTLSFADGTGSSTNSNLTALFRNLDNGGSKVIAPLDFDQRHTAVAVLDFYIPEGELGFFELFNANAIISFNSGRPYTPVDQWDLLGDQGLVSDNTGYVNSAYGPSSFRIDLKVEKGFKIGDLYLTPYVWIENLLDADNVVSVWRSTGSPYTTGWLNDPEAQGTIQQQGEGYVKDYESLEKDPNNFGIPRLIKLGLKLNFDKINF